MGVVDPLIFGFRDYIFRNQRIELVSDAKF